VTGFIKQLFRSKPRTQEVIEPSRPVAPPQTGDAFFLDSDEAKTFGNLDYMRTSRQIRHTFPKQAVGKDNASVKVVSAMEAKRASEMAQASQADQVVPTGSQSERRKADSSMDMFRNMARDIKKS
jgi:hypothetical protein